MRLLPAVALLLAMTLGLAGCAPVTVQDYADNRPLLVPEEFFQGQLTAHGVIKNRSGKVIRYFNADIKAYWENGIGTLEEDFIFDDGEPERRVWTLTPQADGTYTGTAGDVIGDGQITLAGNSMFLDYVLRIPYNDGTLDLRIDDRMYLVNSTMLINESTMTKFGVRVGEILLVIEKRGD
jgi:hypothetical protein